MSDLADDSLPEWTEEERALLRSADGDRPPPRSLPTTLAALGVGSAIVSGTATAEAAGVAAAGVKWGGLAALSKSVAVVALGGVVVASGVVLLKRSDADKEPAAATVPAAPKSAPRPQVA